IVPTLRVGMPQWTLRVRSWDAERPGLRSHAERGNDQSSSARNPLDLLWPGGHCADRHTLEPKALQPTYSLTSCCQHFMSHTKHRNALQRFLLVRPFR
ncbi:hypothetical protein FEM54_31030, partial [Pseudomonas edaphica]